MKIITIAIGVFIFLFVPVYSGSAESRGNPVLSEDQKNVIAYFKEIALGFEYGKDLQITRKWQAPMKIFVGGSPSPTLRQELESIVSELNILITDDFEIEIVDNREDSNFYIHFGSSASYSALFPCDAALAASNSGVYHIYWNRSHYINKGHIFVKTSNISIVEQKHVLREELTQALGLGRDSYKYAESIFQSRFTTVTSYAKIDKDLIRLLYHPKMIVGLSHNEVDMLLAEIILSENSTL